MTVSRTEMLAFNFLTSLSLLVGNLGLCLAEHMGDYKAAASARLPAQPNFLPPGVSGFHKKKKIKSCMWEHTRDFHGGVVGVEDGTMTIRSNLLELSASVYRDK